MTRKFDAVPTLVPLLFTSCDGLQVGIHAALNGELPSCCSTLAGVKDLLAAPEGCIGEDQAFRGGEGDGE